MMTIEEAYSFIANEVLAFVGTEPWDVAGVNIELFDQMSCSQGWRVYRGQRYPALNIPSLPISVSATKAAIFLRDNLVKQHNKNITNIYFSISSEGEFKINYKHDE
ncbi:hypothetical protein ACIQ2O_09065 [Serratia grimesii]|jgi:hypothetical protein|uniref:hypothetical protein n=1 Tax=Serratia grimesii TaxID=82995 RepID=UPI0021B770E1|nr:hypothetical protein [Serratia grimesii]